MEYILLDDGTGFVASRAQETADRDLFVDFVGAPPGSTAVFENAGISFYRKLEPEGATQCCRLSVQDLQDGAVAVSIFQPTKGSRPKKWTCEKLTLTKASSTKAVVEPDRINLQREVLRLKVAERDITRKLGDIESKLAGLQTRLDNLFDGYDFD